MADSSECEPARSVADLSPNQRDHYEERAAIMEYDGGLTRKEAERRALSAAQVRQS